MCLILRNSSGEIIIKLLFLFYHQLIAKQMPCGTFAFPTVLAMKSVYEKYPFYSYKGQKNRCTWAKFKKKKIEETIVDIRTTTVPRRTGNMAAVKKN